MVSTTENSLACYQYREAFFGVLRIRSKGNSYVSCFLIRIGSGTNSPFGLVGKIHSYADGVEKPVIRGIGETGPAKTILRTPPAEQPAGRFKWAPCRNNNAYQAWHDRKSSTAQQKTESGGNMHSRNEALASRPGRYQTTQESVKMQGYRDSWTRAFHKWRVCAFIVVAAFGLVAGSFVAHGQSGAGSIQGTVTDSTGAVMQGASIHIVNQATNVSSPTRNRMMLGFIWSRISLREPTR
jgi:hypothetical protein